MYNGLTRHPPFWTILKKCTIGIGWLPLSDSNNFENHHLLKAQEWISKWSLTGTFWGKTFLRSMFVKLESNRTIWSLIAFSEPTLDFFVTHIHHGIVTVDHISQVFIKIVHRQFCFMCAAKCLCSSSLCLLIETQMEL